MNATKKLKRMISRNEFIMAPGAYDALTARIIEAQGFKCIYMTGYGTSASLLGLPDMGFLTMSEMVQNASRISDAVDIPVIADADTGYGNALNVMRTVREYEKAGVSAIHLEDQVWPKRCGHMDGKKIIESGQMTDKIKAAVDTRESMLIIARTDALAISGLKHAVERAYEYSEAGADIIFIEAPETKEQVEQIPKIFSSKPLLINMAPRTPSFSADELHRLGYSIALYPGVCLIAIIPALSQDIQMLKKNGRPKELDFMNAFKDLNDFLKVPGYIELEGKYKGKT